MGRPQTTTDAQLAAVIADDCRPVPEMRDVQELANHLCHNRMSALINRRAVIEQVMLDASKGKRPMPDADTLRLWALALGIPKKFWTDAIRASLKLKD